MKIKRLPHSNDVRFVMTEEQATSIHYRSDWNKYDGHHIQYEIDPVMLTEMVVQFIGTLDFKKDFDRATYDHIQECMHAHFRSQ